MTGPGNGRSLVTEEEKRERAALADAKDRHCVDELLKDPTGSVVRSLHDATHAAAKTVGTARLNIPGHPGRLYFHGGRLGAGPTKAINLVEAAILVLEHIARTEDPEGSEEPIEEKPTVTDEDLMNLLEL